MEEVGDDKTERLEKEHFGTEGSVAYCHRG